MATLWTIGHSTRGWDEFLALLRDAGIVTVADVRRFPGSRRHPQFGADAMAAALPREGFTYVPMPGLGGRRPARADSPNTAWRNASFRGYADYMAEPGYGAARQALSAIAAVAPTTVMCAEALWWQCHRGLIADDFKADGWQVIHIGGRGRCEPHPYTAAARIVDGRLDYGVPGDPQTALF